MKLSQSPNLCRKLNTSIFISLLFMSILPFGCKKTPTSALKYGAVEDYDITKSKLIQAGPNDKIIICGIYRESAAKAVKTWFEAIGRNANITEQEECPNSSSDFVLRTGNPDTNDFVKSACRNESITKFLRDETYGFTGKKLLLGVCLRFKEVNRDAWDFSHEVGHAFGLCDQYEIGDTGWKTNIKMHETCSDRFRSREGELSAMNSPEGREFEELDQSKVGPDSRITNFDVVALRLMACRGDIKNNQVWFKSNPALINSWRQDSGFVNEINRLSAKGVDFLDDCKGKTTPGVEGSFNTSDGESRIDCCLCSLQDYGSKFGFSKKNGAPYFKLGLITNQKFEDTLCSQEVSKKYTIDDETYRYFEDCEKVTAIGNLCHASKADGTIDIVRGDIDGVSTPNFRLKIIEEHYYSSTPLN
ncbi:hypothetical protein N9D31_03045 [Oligoflexaceae bacterium]|nr:hypothetical protein [Oligoflexaceae bacterium]